jgi:hypothetical protein
MLIIVLTIRNILYVLVGYVKTVKAAGWLIITEAVDQVEITDVE